MPLTPQTHHRSKALTSHQGGGVIDALKKRLFSSWFDALLTLFLLSLGFLLIPSVLNWMIFDATFVGTSRKDCLGEGACWPFVWARMGQFFYGFYPQSEILRPTFLGLGLVVMGLFGSRLYRKSSHQIGSSWFLLFGAMFYPFLAWHVLKGGFFGLSVVETSQWGGLLLTLFISLCGIIWSLPLGVLLALGRRSKLPLIKRASVIFIEVWRGVPLVTILFLASVMFPLFLPKQMTVDKLMRAVTGVTLFAAAYMAEVIRGGLNGVPKGQMEAAQSLGLTWVQSMVLVVLPQALKISIPGIVNTFIGLFKDTSLVLIIGMFDLLGMVQSASTDTEWLGCAFEGYIFAGMVYWVFCFGMSRYSLKLEKRLATDHKSSLSTQL